MTRTEPIALSIVLVTYNMKRELARTLLTFSKRYQLELESECEIIIVDNGSRETIDDEEIRRIDATIRHLKYPDPTSSPVAALNWGVANSSGTAVCVCIDAARMASPRLLSFGLRALNLHPRAVVGCLSYHIGKLPQNISSRRGYDQRTEDALLETIDWKGDGYQLFSVSSFDPSSAQGYRACPAETNALFMRKSLWDELGGFDPRFVSSGGGIANHDVWVRACNDSRNFPVLLIGEGTFHQFHGGVSTNSVADQWRIFNAEYRALRGTDFRPPRIRPYLFGQFTPFSYQFMRRDEVFGRYITLWHRGVGRARRLLSEVLRR